ncbi:MAG TPA: thiamine pyrophosphate-dependent dehydrogenase E1 component subunit alpha [Nannocystaceae bacterium]|nr:thiamine pyrophosphate-dependent dehydrogenase E1 component subunit alpha [Nannocystaceae bacterium]
MNPTTLTSVPDRGTRIELFRQMLRIRLIEEEIARRYAEQRMRCPVHLSVGQEAAAVGACSVLRSTDPIVSTHRCHGHYLAKGGDLNAMIAELHGKATGCCGGRGGSMHLFDPAAGVLASVPIVGSNVPLGVGAALAARQSKRPDVAVAFFGDGAFEEGVVHESANFAGCHRLPVVFVLENNLYSVYTPVDQRQPRRPLVAFAETHGLAAKRVDGNDVLAVRDAMQHAVVRARRGDGPSLLVVDTYRFLEHCGAADDDHLGYRPAGELAAWRERCPIAAMRQRLRTAGELDEATEAGFAAAIQLEIADAFAAADRAPYPAAETAMEAVHA